jgi:hypothetical protein
MKEDETVFEKHYTQYLEQLSDLTFERIAPVLGCQEKNGVLEIPLLGTTYSVSCGGIADPAGARPSYDVCVVLSRYVIMCPEAVPTDDQWVSFRDFKDSGPLTVYFGNNVERAIADCFRGNSAGLEKSGRFLAAYPPCLDATYDIALQFDVLPRIPMVLLFNDTDAEFPATCSVLFERRGEQYLDAECLAILGRQLFERLRQVARQV